MMMSHAMLAEGHLNSNKKIGEADTIECTGDDNIFPIAQILA